MLLFSGSSHPALATALAAELGIPLGAVLRKRFTSGETYVRYEESLRGKDVYILQTGSRSPNEDLMELFLMLQAARLSFAKSIHVVMPHFSYARQDRVAQPREPISARLVAQLLESAGAQHIITLDLHSDQIQGFFTIPVDSLDARKLLVSEFKKKNLVNPVVVAPDAGGAKRAKKFADMLGAELALMHKSRPEHQKAEIVEVVGELEGKTCIIFDDMIDSASTMVPAKEALLKKKANPDVYAAVTHAVFSGKAMENLKAANFKEVVVTDSIPVDASALPQLRVITIAPLLAQVIRNIQSGHSVTELYTR